MTAPYCKQSAPFAEITLRRSTYRLDICIVPASSVLLIQLCFNLGSPFWITEFQHGEDREEYITAKFEDFDWYSQPLFLFVLAATVRFGPAIVSYLV
jgi:hypothetical protein